ncbi:MAG: hypothetical protein Q4C77_15325 [Eubacteriales bacterium]|nr:hypothetical protein [Eubacteriales bacterium]
MPEISNVAVKEADDRYIFSKSVHGRNLSGEEKEWVVLENDEMADKASNYTTYKKMIWEELGDSAKYVKVINKDRNGKKIKPVIKIDQEKLNDDLKYAGYNLMGCAPGLYAKKETIYGHFLICYLSLFLLRVLEIIVFKHFGAVSSKIYTDFPDF